jgi:fatty acid desaturase
MTTTLDRPVTAPSAQAPSDAPPLDDQERARRIRVAVRARSAEVRRQHPILRRQSAIGAGILGASTLSVLALAIAYATGALAWWIVVPLSAIAMSFAHEIEHDTIHRLYFVRNERARDVMFAVCWLLRPYTISPWARRPLHLLHHKASGTELDHEEQGITNGQAWSPKRALMMVDPLAAAVLRLPKDPAHRSVYVRYLAKAYAPCTYLALAVWYGFVGMAFVGMVLPLTGAAAALFAVLSFLAVVWIGPNVLRVACLHFISSNMHYFGDVEDGNVVQQTQVLNRWYFLPAQLFCCNFGSTHGIHHFVPGDPFYVRQLTAKVAHEAMAANGVRFNDLGTFRRANRYAA